MTAGIVKKTRRALNAALTPTGTLGKVYHTTKALGGSITPSGALGAVVIVLTQALKKTRRILMSLLNRR